MKFLETVVAIILFCGFMTIVSDMTMMNAALNKISITQTEINNRFKDINKTLDNIQLCQAEKTHNMKCDLFP